MQALKATGLVMQWTKPIPFKFNTSLGPINHLCVYCDGVKPKGC